jgi:hypothetical protein
VIQPTEPESYLPCYEPPAYQKINCTGLITMCYKSKNFFQVHGTDYW